MFTFQAALKIPTFCAAVKNSDFPDLLVIFQVVCLETKVLSGQQGLL